MYHRIEEWLNNAFNQKIPSAVTAFSFNLYEEENKNWSLEAVGTGSFDAFDDDWACDEVSDFGTRENPLSWHEDASWKEILEETKNALKNYLHSGEYGDILMSREGVGVGFVDGDIEILYQSTDSDLKSDKKNKKK